ncbi:hypothetical protein [uncultured Oxalicibacterium sp.]|uniref:hypothetical protein n=1 Tax=uncultured Oxalicibacterium sp. TaxID=1168540 RepID=UPI0025F7A150|nr:hypothetical protein [uncultured Oxalicibacterium sp.]
MSTSKPDAGIPMLTEIIPARAHTALPDDIPELPVSSALPPRVAASPATSAPFAPPSATVVPSSSTTRPMREHAPIDNWLDEEWTRLEQKISERTLHTILERLDPLLEEQIRESISASLDEAMDTIRTNLQLSVEQLVRDSVAEEIRKLDFSKNKNF